MTMATASTVAARPARRAAAGRASFGGALRSEFTKIRSVRSTYWTLLALVVACVGIGAIGSYGHAHDFGQLVIAVLGALTVTSEYSTGMIRTSLSVLPGRGTVFAAKAVVFGAIALVTGLVTSFASFFPGQAIMSGQHIGVSLGHPGALRAVVGAGLFLAVCGLLSYGLGALIRHTAGAITASIGLLFVLFVLTQFLPQSWAVHIDKWIPFNAGAAIWEHQSAPVMLSPWTGFGVFCGYAAIAMAAGLYRFRYRDT